MSELIYFLITWGPTIFLVVGLILGTLLGVLRGFRKSLILYIHAICVGLVCFGIYMALVEVEAVDTFLPSLFDFFLGGEGSLQALLGITNECNTMKDIILEVILLQGDYLGNFSAILTDNGEYIRTLIDLSYRMIFGGVMIVAYFIILTMMYFVYYIAYSNRKYKRKKNAAYSEGKSDTVFKIRRFGGAVIGFSRALTANLILLSFIGSCFFVIAGGEGNDKGEDLKFENETYNLVYSAYQSIGSYGSEGIFKVLNTVKDRREVPYYLFAVDILFQGGFKHDSSDFEENIYLREEFATYTKFGRDTIDLLIKYGHDDIVNIINGDSEKEIMEVATDVFTNKYFQAEFTIMIDQFESDTYFINLVLSLLDSLAANVDALGLPAEAADFLCIMFKEGYLSESIPYERYLLEQKANDPYADTVNKDKYTLGYIKPTSLLKQTDIAEILYLAFDLLDYATVNTNIESLDFISGLVLSAIPYVERLSILSTEGATELDPALRRIYSYVEEAFLGGNVNDITPMNHKYSKMVEPYSEEKYSNVSWIKEIRTLIDTIDDVVLLVSHIDLSIDPLDLLFGIFAEDNIYGESNNACFDRIIENVSSSAILGEVLSSTLIYGLLEDLLLSSFGLSEMPCKINFCNTIDENGNVVAYGEFYNILCALRALLSSEETKALFELFTESAEEETTDYLQTLGAVVDAINNIQYKGKTIIEYLLASDIVRILLSSLVDSLSSTGLTIYIDDSLYEVDENGDRVKLIKRKHLEEFFDSALSLLEIIQDIPSEPTEDDIIGLISDERVIGLLDSKIIEGTLSYNLFVALDEVEMIIIPTSLISGEGLVTNGNNLSEIKILLEIINEYDILSLLGLGSTEVATLATEEENDPIAQFFDLLSTLEENDFYKLFESKILYYTLSGFLVSEELSSSFIKVIVPNTVSETVYGDSNLSYVVSKDVLVDTFVFVVDVLVEFTQEELPQEEMISGLLTKICENPQELNDLLLATVANFITVNFSETLFLPQGLINYGSEASLKKDFTINPWKKEIIRVLECLNILEISFDSIMNGDINLGIETFFETDQDGNMVLKPYNSEITYLAYCYESIIISSLVSNIIDQVLTEDLIDSSVKHHSLIYSAEFERYYIEEIEALITALNTLGISFDDFAGENDSQVALLNAKDSDPMGDIYEKFLEICKDEESLSKLWGSYLVAGIVTKLVDETFTTSLGIKLPRDMYETNIRVYKKSEITNLANFIALIEEHGFSFDNPDPILILNKVMNGEIPVEECYKSIVFASIVSNYLDEYLTEDLIALNVKHNALPYDSVNEIYRQDEIENFLTAIQTLDVNLGFDGGESDSPEQLIEKILGVLNDQGKLNTIWNSNLAAGIITRQVEINLVNDMKISSKAYKLEIKVLTLDEINNLLNSLEVLEIDLSNLESAAIDPAKIFEDNNLEECYKSYIFANILSSIFDEMLTEDFINTVVKHHKTVYDYTSSMYHLDELLSFKSAMDELGISMDDLSNTSEILDTIVAACKDEEQLKRVWESRLAAGIITRQIENGIGNSIKISPKAYETDIKVFSTTEIGALFDLEEILGINLSDFSLNGISIDTIFDNLRECYESYIFASMFTGILDEKLNETYIRNSVKRHSSVFDQEEAIYKLEALEQFEESLAILGINIAEIESTNLDDLLENAVKGCKENLDGVWASTLAAGIVSRQIEINLAGDSNISSKAYMSDVEVFTKEEINGLFDSCELIDIDPENFDTSGVDYDKVFDKDNMDTFYESYIFSTLLSTIISDALNEDLINQEVKDLPEAFDKEDNRYNLSELKNFINSLELMGIDSIEDINDSSVMSTAINKCKNEEDLKEIWKSIIAAGVITKQIEVLLVGNAQVTDKAYQYDGVFKDSEITNLFRSADNFGIDFEDLDNVSVTFNELFETAEGSSDTKLTVAYRSYIFSAKLTDIIDSFLTSDVIDSSVKTHESVYEEEYLRYKESELVKFKAALDAMNVDLDNFDDDIIAGVIEGIETDLDTIWESRLAAGIVTEQINKNLANGATIADAAYEEDVKIFTKVEVQALLDSADILEIDLADPDLDAINSDKIFDDENLDTFYNSYVFSTVLANAIDGILTYDLIDSSVKRNPKVYEEKYRRYYKTEIKQLKSSLDILGIASIEDASSDDSFSSIIDTCKDPVLLEEVWKSLLAAGIISKQIENVFVGEIEISPKAYQYEGVFSYTEVSSLFESAENVGVDLDNYEDFDVNFDDLFETEEGNDRSNLDIAYDSYIFSSILSSALDDFLYDMVDPAVRRHKDVFDLEDGRYKKEELLRFKTSLDAMNIDFETAEDTTGLIDNVLEGCRNNLDTIWDSKLAAGLITYQISSNFAQGISIPEEAYSEKGIFKYDEVNTIVSFDYNDFTDLESCSVTYAEIRTYIVPKISSYILLAIMSDGVMGIDGIVIPASDYDNDGYIKNTSLDLFVTSIYEMLDKDINTPVGEVLSEDFISTPKGAYDAPFDSTIIRAMVTKQITITDDKGALIDVISYYQDATITKDYRGNDIAIISKEELNAIILASKDITGGDGSYEFALDIAFVSLILDSEYALESSVIKITISNFLITKLGTLAQYIINENSYEPNVKAINITQVTEIKDYKVLTKDSMLSILETLAHMPY